VSFQPFLPWVLLILFGISGIIHTNDVSEFPKLQADSSPILTPSVISCNQANRIISAFICFVTYSSKGVPGLIKEKMERGLDNIDKCLVQNERKVRIYKEYFLPANCFILSTHDLTKMDLKDLNALTIGTSSLG
jgi:hypothetical protein